MIKPTGIFLLLTILIIFASCRKETSSPENCPDCQPSLNEINIDPDFSWESTRDLRVIIHATNSMIVEITPEDGTGVLHKGYFTGAENGIYQTEITLPAYIQNIKINGNLVEIQNDVAEIYFDAKSTDMKSGDEINEIVSYWALDENGGTLVSDEIGDNDGELIDCTRATGISGNAVEFNGESGVITIPEADNLDIISQLTLTAWVKAYDKKEAKIAQKGDWDGYNLGMGKWTGWKGYIMMDDMNYHKVEWDGGIPLMNEWYFVAMTYDGSFLKFYVNGTLRDQKALTGNIHDNQREFSIGSDNNAQKFFHGVIDEVGVYNTALSAQDIQDIYQVMPNTDSDGDGVPDFQDDYDNDPERAFDIFWPANNPGSLAFEDLWPGLGDFDFNDLVLDFQFKTVTNAQNYMVELFGEFTVKAVGASQRNGFGFQFADAFDDSDIEVSGQVLTENIIQLKPNGTELNQENTTIIVFDNTYSILPSAGGTGVNVSEHAPYVEPETIEIYINFTDNKFLQSDLNIENFNPFIFINRNRSKEIHLPDYPPTSLMDESLFGTSHDDSNPSVNRFYKTKNNVPWAILLPEPFDYPLEKMEITEAHLHFVEWAQSSGNSYNDWYLDKPGYRNSPVIY